MDYGVDVEGHQNTYNVDMLQEFTPRQDELKLHKDTPMADCSANAGMIDNISRTCWESAFESCDVHNNSPYPSAVSVINDIPDPIEPGDSCSLQKLYAQYLNRKILFLTSVLTQKPEIHGFVDSISDIFFRSTSKNKCY